MLQMVLIMPKETVKNMAENAKGTTPKERE